MIEFKPPTSPHFSPSIFLAGTIDDGNSADWQFEFKEATKNLDCILFNPRRDDWDQSWDQCITNSTFREQVTWELDHLDKADLIIIYFAPGSQSPISLLELGLYASSKKLRVVCPSGFWRKGNVDIVCERYNIPRYETIEEFIAVEIE